MVKIHSRFDVPQSIGITFTEPTRTQQHFADEVDINQIVARALKTGDVSIFTPRERGEYFDCSDYEDYQSSLDYIAGIEDDFRSLPSNVRKEFGHDPHKYVQFMTDPANLSKAIELGLLEGVEKPLPKAAGSGTPQPSVEPPAAVLPPAATSAAGGQHSSS